jgi:two-component system, cell cycle sensor histidine kinase and response regulator CckA
MQSSYPALALPDLEDVLERFPLVVAPETSVIEAIALMSQVGGSHCDVAGAEQSSDLCHIAPGWNSCALVVEAGRLIGIFTERDVVRLTVSGLDLATVTVAEVMTTELIALRQSDAPTVLNALSLMRQQNIRHLPILADDGQMIGLVTPYSIRQVLQPVYLLKLRLVSEVMATRVIHAHQSASVFELAQFMDDSSSSCVVLLENAQPVGIITERDIVQFKVLELDLNQTPAHAVMSTPLFLLRPSDSLWEAHQQMQRRRVRRLVVQNNAGELVGIVTQTHLLQVLDPIELYDTVELLQDQVEESTLALEDANHALQREVRQRQRVEEHLRQEQLNLENRVKERTAELLKTNALLQQEIQERQRIEETLRQSQQEMTDFIENAPIGMHWVAADGRILWVNQAELDLLGYAREEYIGHSIAEFHADQTIIEDILCRLTSNETLHSYEAQLRCKDGNLRHVLIDSNVLRGENGEFIHTRCFTRNITGRKQAETIILEQAALLNIATDAIMVRNLDQQVLFWNKSAERLYGWTAAAVLHCNINELFKTTPATELTQAIATVVEKGEWQGELIKTRKDGAKVVVFSRWTLVRDEQGEPKSILTVDTDITEKKILEKQFLRAQRMESLGTLAGGIAHDLNNILTPILAAAQLLPLTLPNLDERNQHIVQMLVDSSRRGSDLVQQILSFARGMDGQRAVLQVGHLLAEVVNIARQTFPKSIKIERDISTRNLWTVSADATQLHQIFMNLCVNARDAMPNGGTLSITAENLLSDENYARMTLDAHIGPYVVITIADTGCGMPPEVIERIFDPFFTTKGEGKGTGLGLSTALGIIKSHGGFITVHSEIGLGSCFKVYLPAAESEVSVPTDGTSSNLMGNGELILTVDDEASILEITKISLEAFNYKTLTAKDGIEALALFAEHYQSISFVLLDLMMPSLDSATIIRTLQRIDPQVQIITMSGLATNEVVNNISQNVKASLAKPFTAQELLQTLHNLKRSAWN